MSQREEECVGKAEYLAEALLTAGGASGTRPTIPTTPKHTPHRPDLPSQPHPNTLLTDPTYHPNHTYTSSTESD
ncbi:hypothetical protein Pcinc_039998 [Petrolisthes cinctipes]|uniref:Uncharacterized protein n=1 Tax=Petrolisthes cinctipes TaxID=88211 RepID=A0AAE1BR54_PETCI|nr:hypothetical protein Pcinc_039998 [Petrolisthes cinctipes]